MKGTFTDSGHDGVLRAKEVAWMFILDGTTIDGAGLDEYLIVGTDNSDIKVRRDGKPLSRLLAAIPTL